VTRLYKSLLILIFIGAGTATAQQRPIFDPDDFVDPRQHSGPVFISRLIVGGALKPSDDYRPLRQNTAFVVVTNSFFWKRMQFDYKHSEEFGSISNDPEPVTACGCKPPLYFPTAPPPGAPPLAPLPGPKDTLQAAWYGLVPGRAGEPSVMLRFRLTATRRTMATEVLDAGGHKLPSLSGREESIGLDADTYFRIGRHNVFGSLVFARTSQSGTTHDRSQSELTYTSRFPAIIAGKVLILPKLTVGGVTARGTRSVNVVNPSFEAFFHQSSTRANYHLVWSPQRTRSDARGWETHNQIAFYVDRALYVGLRGPKK